MVGSLESVNVADILLELHLSRKTGILRLTTGETRKSVYFINGAIVFAHSNLNQDRLGETLLRLGKINQQEFEAASADVIEKGKRLGQALRDRGCLSLAEVNAGVNYQLQHIVYSVFNWESGQFEFIERERPVFEDIMINVSTADLLLQGVRNTTNRVVLRRSFGDDESRMLAVNTSTARIPMHDLDFTEETIFACVGNGRTIAMVRQLARVPPIEFDRAVCSLLLSGLIRVEDSAAFEKPEPLSKGLPIGYETQPMTDRRGPPPTQTASEEQVRQMILDTDKLFTDVTDEEVLGVLPGATEAEIQQAYDRKTQIFHPALYSENRYEDVKLQLRRILNRLVLAYENLLQRPDFVQPLDEATPAKAVGANTPSPIADSSRTWTTRELEQRLAEQPTNVQLLLLLAKKFQDSGRPLDAEKQLLRALEIAPQSIQNHFALAEFYEHQGLKFKAHKHLKIVLQLDPDNSRASEQLGIQKRKRPLYEISSDGK